MVCWLEQVRLKDLLGKWGEAFPDWKEEDAMRGFIENEVKEVMLECMSKLVCPARKSGQVGCVCLSLQCYHANDVLVCTTADLTV